MKYYTYAIASTKERYIYIGHSNNIKRRLREHNAGKTSSNKRKAPFKLILCEEYRTREEAVERERQFKKSYNREKLRALVYKGELPERSKGAVC